MASQLQKLSAWSPDLRTTFRSRRPCWSAALGVAHSRLATSLAFQRLAWAWISTRSSTSGMFDQAQVQTSTQGTKRTTQAVISQQFGDVFYGGAVAGGNKEDLDTSKTQAFRPLRHSLCNCSETICETWVLQVSCAHCNKNDTICIMNTIVPGKHCWPRTTGQQQQQQHSKAGTQ